MEFGVVVVILVALGFDYVNGFHDAANSIATVVSTRVLSPRMAVAWAAFFNFIAFLVFGTHVATTIAKDVVVQDALSIGVVFAGLVGAIVWDLITFWFGLPTSSSHALVGGMAGAAVAAGRLGRAGLRRHPQDRRLHRAVAAGRPRARHDDDDHRVVGCSTATRRSKG